MDLRHNLSQIEMCNLHFKLKLNSHNEISAHSKEVWIWFGTLHFSYIKKTDVKMVNKLTIGSILTLRCDDLG